MDKKYRFSDADEFLNNVKNDVSDRDYKLIEKAVWVLDHNISDGEGTPWYGKRTLLPSAERFKGIWNWDTAFHCVGLSRFDVDFAMEHMEVFCEYQLDDGMFVDNVSCKGEKGVNFTKPPVMAWACEVVYRKSGDKEFLRRMYNRLVKNVEFWETKRKSGDMFHYDTLPGDYAFEHGVGMDSGWDNSVRWDKNPDKLWAVDLNCFMVMTYRSMEYIASELSEDGSVWKSKAEKLSKDIEENLWNDKLGCYTERNYVTGEFSDVLSPASFMPLYIEVASQEHAMQAEKAAVEKFGYGMPTVSYDNPNYSRDYWRGPTWLNVAYFAAKGLKNYGFSDTADKIKQTILGWVENNGDKIHENYDSKTGEGLCAEYFSWSAVFVIEFILNF